MSRLEAHFNAELLRRREKALVEEAARQEAEALKTKSPERLRLERVLSLLEESEDLIHRLGLRIVDREKEVAIEASQPKISINLSNGRYQVTLLSVAWHAPSAAKRKAPTETPKRSGIAFPLDAEDCEWFDEPEQVEERVGFLLAKIAHQQEMAVSFSETSQ